MNLHTTELSAKPRPQHILIVDDEAVIRDMMVDILSLEGFQVLVARNGREALTRLREATPDEGFLIFLDLMMPIMDGYDFCYALHADVVLSRLHTVVIMSALDQLARATSLHVDATMPKPFVMDDIMHIIQTYMD